MKSKQPLSVALCTVPDEETAKTIANALVERQLAACVNIIGPIRSVYRWQGQIEDDSEYQLVIKTASNYVDDGFSVVKQLHPYEVCEWVVLPADASESYWNWMRSNLK